MDSQVLSSGNCWFRNHGAQWQRSEASVQAHSLKKVSIFVDRALNRILTSQTNTYQEAVRLRVQVKVLEDLVLLVVQAAAV